MLFRLALTVGVFSVAILASDPFTSAGFAKQGTGVQDSTRRALDSAMRLFVDQQAGRMEKPGFPMPIGPFLTARANVWPAQKCAIPLLELRVPHPERFDNMGRAIGSTKFDDMAVAPPIPVCKDWQQEK
jgi:hypothetical protein